MMQISERFLDNGSVVVPISECSLVFQSELHNAIVALLQDGDRLLLLEDCGIGENGIGTREYAKIEEAKELYCPLRYVKKLDYETAEQAIHDMKWVESLNKEIRRVDALAYNDWCDLNR